MALGRTSFWPAAMAAGTVLVFGVAAWFRIQSVRLGYDVQSLLARLEDEERRGQVLDRRIDALLSLSRLDRLSREQFHLQVPRPSQILLLPDPE